MKKILIISLLIFTILVSFFNISYASVAVTKENLTEAFKNFVSSESNKDNYTVSVENNVINITEGSNTYQLNYDLTDKPTFWYEVPIEKGISYENFKKQTDEISLPMLGYVAVAATQGVKAEDAMGYFGFSYLGSALNGDFSSENSYVIVDDLNLSEGVTIEKTDDPKTIYTSEFGDRVMDYVNALYPKTLTISDSKEVNSYVMTIEKKDVTKTSCKLVSTLIINTNADFSKLNGTMDKVENSFLGGNITKENADYVLTLKVGQKCLIQSENEITGHAISGESTEINDKNTEITAIKTGITKGYFSIGKIKKTFYFTVEENTENKTLEPITLTINVENTLNNTTNNSLNSHIQNIRNEYLAAQKNEKEKLQESTSHLNNKLPQTGDSFSLKDGLFLLILACVVGIIILIVPNSRYKNYKNIDNK